MKIKVKCYFCGHKQNLDLDNPHFVCDKCGEYIVSSPFFEANVEGLRKLLKLKEEWIEEHKKEISAEKQDIKIIKALLEKKFPDTKESWKGIKE